MPSPHAVLDEDAARPAPSPDPTLRIEHRSPASLNEAEIEAWRALARRGLEPSVFSDPDFVLPAAQHLAARREIVLHLAWQDRAGARGPVLRGVLAVQHPPRFRLIDAATMPRSQLDLGSAALVDAGYANEALSALLGALDAGARRTSRLTLMDLAGDGALVPALRRAAASVGYGVEARTCRRAAAVQPASAADPGGAIGPRTAERAELEHLADVRGVREGVELFLTFDAGVAARAGAVEACLLDDPVGTTVLRVVTRRLARRRLCRVVLARRDGLLVGAAIVLRLGSRSVVWRQAGRIDLPPEAASDRIEVTLYADGSGPAGIARRLGRRIAAPLRRPSAPAPRPTGLRRSS